jgi:3-hydroxyacyl-[acyl-carrier-protein] dehydratase
MHFSLIDRVLEHSVGQSDRPDRLVAIKHVSAAEEYLQDHFATFPVLPGVLMLEAMVQAARELLVRTEPRFAGDAARSQPRWVLGKVRALKYGTFVPPGSTLRVEVERLKSDDRGQTGAVEFKGVGKVIHPGSAGWGTDPSEAATAVSGRFALRAVRTA